MIDFNLETEFDMDDTVMAADAWLVEDDAAMVYGVYECDWMARAIAQAAADEDGEPVAIVPLYRAMLTDEERNALEKAITVAQTHGHIDFPLVIRWLLERTT